MCAIIVARSERVKSLVIDLRKLLFALGVGPHEQGVAWACRRRCQGRFDTSGDRDSVRCARGFGARFASPPAAQHIPDPQDGEDIHRLLLRAEYKRITYGHGSSARGEKTMRIADGQGII